MPSNDQDTRAGIEIAPLIAQLTDHALGKVELTPAQVRSIEILLRKALPDLASLKSGDRARRHEDALAEFE
jgi:hypothetical protein